MEKEVVRYKDSAKNKYILSDKKLDIVGLLLSIMILIVFIGVCIISYYL
jgi:hypothetical protein